MNTSTTRRGEWVLTREAFDKLLARLNADRDRAGEQYEAIRLKLVKFFEWRGSALPEEHADELISEDSEKLLNLPSEERRSAMKVKTNVKAGGRRNA